MRPLSLLYMWMLAPAMFLPVVLITSLKQYAERSRIDERHHRPPRRARDPIYLYYAKRKLHHSRHANYDVHNTGAGSPA